MSLIRLQENTSTPSTPPTDNVRVYARDDKNLYMIDDAGSIKCLSGTNGFARLSDTKAQNTAPASLVATTWTTREITTEDVDANGIVSISSNQFTPVAGTYQIRVAGTLYADSATTVNALHRLYNVTGAAVVFRGVNVRAIDTAGVQWTLSGTFTANGTSAYAVQYYASASTGALGYVRNVASESEYYLQIELVKVG